MKPISFPQANTTYATDQPEYLPLPAHRSADLVGQVTSCWALTWRERLSVLLRGRVFLSVWTFNQPLQPQRMSVRFEP
jgi:hypothetical protein